MAAITAEPTAVTRPLTAASHGERNPQSLIFLILLWASLAFGILVLVVLLVNTFLEGRSRMDAALFTNYTSQIDPATAGARAAILGTAWVIGTTALRPSRRSSTACSLRPRLSRWESRATPSSRAASPSPC